jgi:organic hydroperoxide reductase OsmC/OhrA
LRLDSKEAATKGGKDGAVITVGDAEKSCPVSRVLNAAITLDAKLT